MNQFHAAESSQRAASDVFKSSATQQASGIASRFASSGKFTHEQLESGEDGKEGKAAEEEDEFDPDDKRPLYERLKSQRDEKQAEWDHAHTFKNQMDHWRLDADDAAFEEDRKYREANRKSWASRARFDSLTDREREIARLSVGGFRGLHEVEWNLEKELLPDAPRGGDGGSRPTGGCVQRWVLSLGSWWRSP